MISKSLFKIIAFLLLLSKMLFADVPYQKGIQRDPALMNELRFRDAKSQALAFIVYYHSIRLNIQEKKIKNEALSSIPAPCCSDYPASTCCCVCNIIRTVWGLSHLLIREYNFDAESVRVRIMEWLEFINPHGYAGDACFKDGCEVPFHKDGCGGMNENQLTF